MSLGHSLKNLIKKSKKVKYFNFQHIEYTNFHKNLSLKSLKDHFDDTRWYFSFTKNTI